MIDIIISVKNLQKNYGDFAAVKGISFDVRRGEIFGLLGPNGAGKSTTLEIIETLREKTSGEVFVDGFNLDDSPNEIKKIIGVQLQTSGYYPSLTLTELIYLFAGLYNEVIDPLTLLDRVNLRDKAKAKFKELSGGQKQRILIARAVYKDPNYLFFDEATNSLDANNEKAIVENLQQFFKGRTVVVVAHRLSTVKNADKIVVLHEGKIAEVGTHAVLSMMKGRYYELVKNQLELGN